VSHFHQKLSFVKPPELLLKLTYQFARLTLTLVMERNYFPLLSYKNGL
jgi:hypothetical protein